jgi:hypothetical protein
VEQPCEIAVTAKQNRHAVIGPERADMMRNLIRNPAFATERMHCWR